MTPSLSSLTPTDKISLAAELDGFTCVFLGSSGGYVDDMPENWKRFQCRGRSEEKPNKIYCLIPDYSTSYDAIIPLIQKQPRNVINKIGLWEKLFVKMFTPSQLLDALLVATGKATI